MHAVIGAKCPTLKLDLIAKRTKIPNLSRDRSWCSYHIWTVILFVSQLSWCLEGECNFLLQMFASGSI